MNKTLYKDLDKIQECIAEQGQATIYNSPFKSVIEIYDYYYPFDLMGDDEYKKQCKKEGYENLYQPIAEFLKKCKIKPFPEAKLLSEQKNHNFLLFVFSVEPSENMRKKVRAEARAFFAVPFIDDDNEQSYCILVTTNRYGGIIEELKYAELISPDIQNTEIQTHWATFTQAITAIKQELNLEPNTEITDLDSFEEALNEFVSITDIKKKQTFKNQWKKLQQNPKKYIDQLVHDGFYGNANQKQINYQFLLQEYLQTYDDDFPIDIETFTDYLQNHLGKKIDINETDLLYPKKIADDIERQTNYTLLNIDNQLGYYTFYVCSKNKKDKILSLAKQLNFPFDDEFSL